MDMWTALRTLPHVHCLDCHDDRVIPLHHLRGLTHYVRFRTENEASSRQSRCAPVRTFPGQ